MFVYSSITFDTALASHHARVASATRHRHVETPQRSPAGGASADHHHRLSQRYFRTSRPSRRSLRRLAR